MKEIDLYNFNFLSRDEYRYNLILEFLKESPGTGSGELSSKYIYFVEYLKNGKRIYLKRPAIRNYGMDFTVHLENSKFKYSNIPAHSEIIEDLLQKKSENFIEYKKVKIILNKLYNCEIVNENEYLDIHLKNGLEIEDVLKLIKWLFLEQDVTYWNYSGRAKLYQTLKENELV